MLRIKLRNGREYDITVQAADRLLDSQVGADADRVFDSLAPHILARDRREVWYAVDSDDEPTPVTEEE